MPLRASPWVRRRTLAAAAFLGLALTLSGAWAEPSRLARLAPRSLLLDVASADGLTVAVGERGHVLRSLDQGRTWAQVQVPTRATLTGVHLRDASLGWVVGHDEVILRTDDGGQTWALVHEAPGEQRPLLDVWFRDESRGLAVGAYGAILATADGGRTWAPGPATGDEWHLNHITASASGRVYLAAEAGNLYRSHDGGDAWQALPSPYEGSFFGTLPLEGDGLLAFGLRGHLFRSDDGGDTWQPVETGLDASLTCGVRLADGRVVLAGHAGAVLVSDDGGRSFRRLERADRRALSALVPGEGDSLIAVGEGGFQTLRP
ncbi:MAG: WD40/YVTN/BNR-like repeat-containing protein [Deferrisomatales bacterium]